MRSRASARVCASALCLLAACGRVGVDLTPGSSSDGGAGSDAGDVPGVRDGAANDGASDEPSDGAARADASASDDASTRDDASTSGDSGLSDGAIGDASLADAGTTTCSDLTGVWAVRLDVALSWEASATLDPGMNQPAAIWLRLTTANQASEILPGEILLCGLTVPDFRMAAGLGNELYGLEFPLGTFDRAPPTLPNTPVTVTLGATIPGASFAMRPVAVQSGVMLADPLSDPWPSATSLVQANHDGDAFEGVTVPYKTGGAYSYPPINLNQTARGISSYFAARMTFSLNGALTDCGTASGPATMTNYDTHILGCRVVGNTRNCMVGAAPQESGVLDLSRPVWTASSESFRAKKLSAGATCASVRAAFP